MKYRDILGFSKKNKKTIKESKKPKKNQLIESINEEMWNYPMQQFKRLQEQDKPMTKIPD